MTCGGIWALTLLSLLGVAGTMWAKEDDDVDKIFDKWGRPGSATEGLAWYPTDFLRDVVPKPCHSHNDYWRKVPLFSALRAGCISVEADVWHLDDDDTTLYVGHDEAALTPNRTFASLYVDPLVDLLRRANAPTEFYNASTRGVFDYDPSQTLVLLVDFKTDGAALWPHVVRQLEPLRSKGWLTFFADDDDGGGGISERQVTVVGTGNTPFDLVVKQPGPGRHRDIFFDAPLGEMWENPYAPDRPPPPPPAEEEKWYTYNTSNSFYASTNFGEAVGRPTLAGLSGRQLQTIRGQIRGAHRRGLKTRYWETPGWPVGLRNEIWHTLVAEGADILNVDDLKGATEKEW
ncbi:hypothetical protein F4778DRAFT_770055 [Xylariomycetidae sp. FL2044]|nr:hypothetical protein F4778DRAFT_770055 [Xylariomycetidae sp. FL2044]